MPPASTRAVARPFRHGGGHARTGTRCAPQRPPRRPPPTLKLARLPRRRSRRHRHRSARRRRHRRRRRLP
eukprot:3941909-Prymnesium_polylepis.2